MKPTLLILTFLAAALSAPAGPVQNGGFESSPQNSAALDFWQAQSGSRFALTGCSSPNATTVNCTSNTTGIQPGMRVSGAGLVTSPANATLIVAVGITLHSFTVSGGTIVTCPASLLVSNAVPPPALTNTRSAASPHAGTYSLRVDGRDSPSDGMKQNLSGLVNGRTYTTRFAIKVDAPAQVRCLVQPNGTATPAIMGEIVVDAAHAGLWVPVEGIATLSWSGAQTTGQMFFTVDQVYSQGTASPAGAFPGFNLDSVEMETDTDGDGLWDSEEGPGTGCDPLLADTDGDTMPDKWERTHQFQPGDATDAVQDADGDGHSNKVEYWANTHPRDKASYPGIPSDPLSTTATRALLYYLQTRGARGDGRYVTGHHAQTFPGDYNTYVAGLNTLMAAAGHDTWVSILSIAAEGSSAAQPLQIATSAPFLRSYMDAGGLGLIHWTPRNPWTNGSNGDKSGVDIANLLTPGTAANVRFTGWMDAVAAEIALCGPDRPVMFRPFSEQNGGWNWYGRLPREEFNSLYRWLRSYFVNTKGLHNIIWTIEHHIGVHRAGSTGNPGVSMDYYYPGDDVIDLVGFSNYVSGWNPGFDANAQSRLHPKAFAITEGGPPPNEDDVPNAYNSLYLPALDAWFPRAAFFVIWNSWPTGPFVAIRDNANYVGLLTDPRVTNRENLNWLHTVAAWQAAHGLLHEPLTADGDGDGLTNLLEAAGGTDPLLPSGPAAASTSVTAGGQTYPAITFTRDPAVADVTLTAEVSTDLKSWAAATTEVSRVVSGGLETITVRSNTPASAARQYLRVTATTP